MSTPANQELISRGWKLSYICTTCKGEQQHYLHDKHPTFEIILRIKKNSARIIQENNIIAGPFWIYLLPDQMELHIPKITTAT